MAEKGLVELVDVSKSFPSGEQNRIDILRSVSLSLPPTETLAVVGPSGSGKSTLLNIIGTLDQATSGQVFLNGRSLSGLTPSELATLRQRELGFVFQSHHLLPQCSLLENVLVPTLAGPRPEAAQALDRGRKLLQKAGLEHRLDHFPGQLSGGERQRVAVVRALINRPRLLLADEPTGALDHESAEAVGKLLLELNREEGVTLVVVTHSLELARQMKRVMELREGKLVAQS